MENSPTRETLRLEALRIAASLSNDVVRPDAAIVVDMAKVFADFVLGNGEATQLKRTSNARKSQATSES